MKISLVIPAYNEENYIGNTLDSVMRLKHEGYEFEVIVIDGGSTDNTASVATQKGARVFVIKHRGIGFARQEGIRNATGEIVAFTDADTQLPENWLINHIRILTSPNTVMTYGPFKVTDGIFPYFHYINYVQYYGWGFISRTLGFALAAGQNMVFWKDKALEIGGFDENLFIMEDNDFSMRMSKIGKVTYVPEALVYSSGRRSKEGWRFFWRMLGVFIAYYILRQKNMSIFPDFR